ncbi:MAG: CpaF family protein [Nitrospirales bacterium]|nr:CpaF family protein [Nitrospira sp.]MDR4502564.1 CpaF family protein [Nitrospirales bacterium]
MDSQRNGHTTLTRSTYRERLNRSLTTRLASRLRATERQFSSTILSEGPEKDRRSFDRPKADYTTIKGMLQERMLLEIGEQYLYGSSSHEVSRAIQDFTTRILTKEHIPLNEDERRTLADELTEETIGLGPLAPLLTDPAVTDILVNGPEHVYVERFGRIERTEVKFLNKEHIARVIERIAAQMGRRIDTSWPMADLRLTDGTRVNATLPPVSTDGPTLSIRRFGRQRLRKHDLITLDVMSSEMAIFLGFAVRAKRNILISGGTGAGKSTVLGALAESIPAHERIVTIEDTVELSLDQEHVVRLETRPANIEGRGIINTRDLLINTLRMRPDRIVVGEVRGDEAVDMLQAMNTGHEGSMSTIHANSPPDALSRLETMVMMAGSDLPSFAIREQIVSAIHLVIHVRRYEDGLRRVERISEVVGRDGVKIIMQDLFQYHRPGVHGSGTGYFGSCGVVPRMLLDFQEYGLDVPFSLFEARNHNVVV